MHFKMRSQNDFLALHIGIVVEQVRFALHHVAHACNLRRRSEHLVVTLLPVNQLQLVEFHIILLFLYEVVFARDLLRLVLDHLEVLGPGRARLVQLLQLVEFVFKFGVFFLEERASVVEFSL